MAATALARRLVLKRLGLRHLGNVWTQNGRKVSITDASINGTADNTWSTRLRLWRRRQTWKE
jgi:hypothetical protein